MEAKPRAYEPHRLLDAIRGQSRVLIGVALVALFGGAAVARWLVPDLWLGRASARIGYEPHAVLSRGNEAQLLAAAAAHAGSSEAELRKQLRVSFGGRDRLTVEVRGAEAERTRKLVQEIAGGYVTLANARAESLHAGQRAARSAELARARGARDQAQLALQRAMPAAQAADEARLREQLAELDAALQAAMLAPPARPGPRSDAAEAQRQLSRMLANGAGDEEVAAVRAKIARAQRAGQSAPPPLRPLQTRIEGKRAELARLEQATTSLLPLRQTLQAAEDEVSALAARVDAEPSSTHSALDGPLVVEPHSRRGTRVLASLLAPVIAVLLLVGVLVLRELTDLRVCEATEVAHWLAVPVLTSSAWPRRSEALESLVDALADPALESLGTTLILPLSEIERPLAGTLTAQLNARAQRQYRSRTGSRVTIAQEWHGELDSSRIERAAHAADRVLWVVAADTHRGDALAARRALVRRKEGVAAVLVDAEPALVRTVGLAREFWKARTQLPEPVAVEA
ncbi:MAG TPA: hypothetical protein VFX59_22090 [Polyangiales bacterium]|nr:hypothetical protein [Polyangiales bacterium]